MKPEATARTWFRVDLEADAAVLLGVDDESRTPRGERLGEHHRSAAVEHTRWTMSSRVDRHAGGRQIVFAGLDELDADERDQRVLGLLVHDLDRKRLMPDRHRASLRCRRQAATGDRAPMRYALEGCAPRGSSKSEVSGPTMSH